jgi:soluble lytic murein transglycosylase-like protein
MRRHVVRAGSAVIAGLLLATGVVGCARQEPRPQEVAAPVDVPAEPSTEPSVDEPTAAPTAVQALGAAPSASATAKPTPTKTRAGAPRPTVKPPTETKAPPPPRTPAPSGCKPTYQGTQATRAQAKAALTDAAARTYWPVSAPDISIPLQLVKATAWQESGWQSNIIACDKGIGLMQVQPETVTWLNQRFEQSYDVYDYRDNAYLGGTYLAWLTKKIGDSHFGSDYRLDADLCTAELTSCLLDAVIAAYNYGVGAVAVEAKPLVIPNPQYVRNVRALMTECVCLSY